MAKIIHLSSDPMPLTQVPANLRRHVDPKAPFPLRDMGAKGLAPGLTPTDLAIVLFQLQFDPDERLKETSGKTFAELPDEIAGPITSAELPVAVLDFCARRWLGKRDDLVEHLLRSRYIDDQTVALIASRCSDRISEIVAENQVRLTRTPLIIELLYQNPKVHQSIIDRVVEFAKRQNVNTNGLPGLKQAINASEADKSDPAADKAPDDEVFSAILQSSIEQAEEEEVKGITTAQIEAKVSEFAELLEQAMQQTTGIDFGGMDDNPHKAASEQESDEDRVVSKQILIQGMKIAQKVRMATVGSREDRALLIRDPNRIVHMAAVLSPKIQIKDLKDFAGNKDIPLNVINYIASRKEATRDYQMLLKLVNNPKLGLSTGIKMLNFLRANDLRALTRSRNVNPQLAKAAKNLQRKRQGSK